MRLTTLVAALAIVLAPASPAAAPASDRVRQWQEDLQLFASRFPADHIDFAKLYDRTTFDTEIAVLKAGIDQLSDAEITLRLMKLVARAKVAHTYATARPFRPFHRLPLALTWYSDGLAVVGADPQYAAAIGTQVVRIGSMTPEQVLAAVAPYLSYETEAGLRAASADRLTMLELLQQVGAAGKDGPVDFTVARPGAEPFKISVAPGHATSWRIDGMFDALHLPAALYRKNPNSYYWYEYLPESKAIYIQYNRCQNDPKLAFNDFARDLFAFADGHAVERVLVDLRFNGGGNSRVIHPLVSGLKSRRARVYALIGPGTFSSGVLGAWELRRDARAVLVGEPTGERPNSYGEVRSFELPNSGIRVQYSTHFFRLVKDSDPPAFEPDVVARRTLADALAGRDPVLETALAHVRR